MKRFFSAFAFLIAALFTQGAWAAPAVVASQSTATSGTSHVLAVPAGAAGETIFVVIAPDYTTNAPLSGPAGWSQRTNTLCSRYAAIYWKVSDGTETSLTATSSASINAQAHVLRVSGLTSQYIQLGQRPYNQDPGTNAPDPQNIKVSTYGDALFIAGTFYNGVAPTLHPSGYGFPLDAQNTVNLSLSFKFAVGPSDDPGAFALPSTQKACAFGIGLR